MFTQHKLVYSVPHSSLPTLPTYKRRRLNEREAFLAEDSDDDEPISSPAPPALSQWQTILSDAPDYTESAHMPSWYEWKSRKVNALAVCPRSNRIVTACQDGNLRVFAPNTLPLHSHTPPEDTPISPTRSSMDASEMLSPNRPSLASRRHLSYSSLTSATSRSKSTSSPTRLAFPKHRTSKAHATAAVSTELATSASDNAQPRNSTTEAGITNLQAVSTESLADWEYDMVEPSTPRQPAPLVPMDPIMCIELNAGQSPIVGLQIAETKAVGKPSGEDGDCYILCLTANGHFYKLNMADGSCTNRIVLPHSRYTRFDMLSERGTTYAMCVGTGNVVHPINIDQNLSCAPIELQNDNDFVSFQFTKLHGENFCLSLQSSGDLFVKPIKLELDKSSSISAAPSHRLGSLGDVDDSFVGFTVDHFQFTAWTSHKIVRFALRDQSIQILGQATSSETVRKVFCTSPKQCLVASDYSVERITFPRSDRNGNQLPISQTEPLEGNLETIAQVPHGVHSNSPSSNFLAVIRLPDGGRKLLHISANAFNSSANPLCSLYESKPLPKEIADSISCSSIVKDLVLLGFKSGAVASTEIGNLLQPEKYQVFEQRLPSEITTINAISLSSSHQIYVAGCDRGVAYAWRSDGSILQKWEACAAPITAIQDISQHNSCTTIAVIGADSTILLLEIELELEGTYPIPKQTVTIPAQMEPLTEIHTHDHQVALQYGKTVLLWQEGSLVESDVVSLEGWSQQYSHVHLTRRHCLEVDMRTFTTNLDSAWSKSKVYPRHGDLTKSQDKNLKALQTLCSLMRSLEVNTDFEAVKEWDHLHINLKHPASFALEKSLCTSYFNTEAGVTPLGLSRRCTSQYLICLILLVRSFLALADVEKSASELIAYYSSHIFTYLDPRTTQPPSLSVLVDYRFDEFAELRETAKMLFGTAIHQLQRSQIDIEIERWRKDASTTSSFKSCAVLGLIAVEKYSWMSSLTLKELAAMVSSSLDSPDQVARTMAIEICAIAFGILQNYGDAVPLLRKLTAIATSEQGNQLRSPALQATLAVASVNSPLFMTVLLQDILAASSTPAQRNASMRLVAVLIRKKPLVLQHSLPRLSEAVVKSLDPTTRLVREAVQQTATGILRELVETYPSIDFHAKTQRLYVGTNEGSVVVYDLTTSTRLYVLDSEEGQTAALKISPNGRRLVTVILGEKPKVAIWKVGTSILGVFKPGVPSQGPGKTSGNEAFKTYDFNFASPEESSMSPAAQLEWLKIRWEDDARFMVTFRESNFTFAA